MRYLIVEKTRGLFLGMFRNYFLFAKDNVFAIAKVPSFNTENDALQYISENLSIDGAEYGVISVESKHKYVSIVDVIKQGYSEYTHDLIHFLPMQSEAIH